MQQIWGNLQVLAQIPVLNLGLLIDGLMIGAVFALAAYGLALVWGVMNVKNLAQGRLRHPRRLRLLHAGSQRRASAVRRAASPSSFSGASAG